MSLIAERMTKKYKVFLPDRARILNYKETASGRPCDICGHEPEKKPPKPGYPDVSEEMRQMRVRLPEGTRTKMGKADFTVTGDIIEINVCKDTVCCRSNAAKLKGDDGEALYDDSLLGRFR